MSARRCSMCLVNWPIDPHFNVCPECGRRTDFMTGVEPINEREADSRYKHAEFERWYARREKVRADAGRRELEEIERSLTNGEET